MKEPLFSRIQTPSGCVFLCWKKVPADSPDGTGLFFPQSLSCCKIDWVYYLLASSANWATDLIALSCSANSGGKRLLRMLAYSMQEWTWWQRYSFRLQNKNAALAEELIFTKKRQNVSLAKDLTRLSGRCKPVTVHGLQKTSHRQQNEKIWTMLAMHCSVSSWYPTLDNWDVLVRFPSFDHQCNS